MTTASPKKTIHSTSRMGVAAPEERAIASSVALPVLISSTLIAIVAGEWWECLSVVFEMRYRKVVSGVNPERNGSVAVLYPGPFK